MKDVIIVGGGIGGLCTAIRLLVQNNGNINVTIIEKEQNVGGRVNTLEKDGFTFDLTASLLINPLSYTEIFKYAGKNYKDYFNIKKLDTLYKVFYSDGTIYEFPYDKEKRNKNLEEIEKGLSISYNKFIYKSLEKYLIAKEYFLSKPLICIKEVLSYECIKNLIIMNPFETSYKFVRKIIKNEKIQEYLLFQNMFIGLNPYENSDIYSLIPAITESFGFGFIEGGMYEYIKSLQKLILELGGNIITNEMVHKVITVGNKAKSVMTNKKIYKADIVIMNSDFPYNIKSLLSHNYEGLYSKANIDSIDMSCSVFMLYLGLNKKYNVKVHNLYISSNFINNMEDPFKGILSYNPSMYIYCKEAEDNNDKSTLNIMVRVPNLSFSDIKWDNNVIKNMRDSIINELSSLKEFKDISESIITEAYLTPNDIKEGYNCYNGNCFGINHNLEHSLYLRPSLKSKTVDNLYFIGASTHPGNGVSVIIDGSRVLSELIKRDVKF